MLASFYLCYLSTYFFQGILHILHQITILLIVETYFKEVIEIMGNLRKTILPVILFVLITQLVGFVSSYFTQDASIIYNNLVKPPLSPPSYVFGVVWVILYTLMGISAGIIYTQKSEDSKKAITDYLIQLLFNMLWTILFFKYQNYWLAFLTILILDYLVLKLIFTFKELNKTAALLLVPYFIWLLFATYLNFAFAYLN